MLSVELHCPETFALGERTRFAVSIRNRLPVPLAVALPTSRLWGWAVDGIAEADARGYELTRVPHATAFDRGERRMFEATWDGRIRRAGDRGDVWEASPGTHTLSGYLAVADPEERGVIAQRTISVVDADKSGGRH